MQIYYFQLLTQQQQQLRQFRLQLQQHNPVLDPLSSAVEEGFSKVGPGCDLANLDDTPGLPQDLTPDNYGGILPITLEIGFRLVAPSHTWPIPNLDYTSHHHWVFEAAFASHNDEVIADAVCAWIVGGDPTSPGSFVGYLTKRVERDAPFSPRLRWMSIHAIESIWPSGQGVSVLETVHLLNHLNVDVDDMEKEDGWPQLLVGLLCSPTGLESLSSHYWHLLDKLALARHQIDSTSYHVDSASCRTVTRSLEEAEDWEKLEVWMLIVWQSIPWFESVEDFEGVTLKLLLQQPSALPRFGDMCKMGGLWTGHKVKLQQICNQVQLEQSPPESLPL